MKLEENIQSEIAEKEWSTIKGTQANSGVIIAYRNSIDRIKEEFGLRVDSK